MRINPRNLIWLFARFDGRIGREVYWLSSILVGIIVALLLAPFLAVDEEAMKVVFKGGAIGYVIAALGTVSSFAIGVKRVHDLGWPGVAALGLIVPLFSFLFLILIGVLPSQPGANRYGERANVRPEDV